MAGVLFIIWIPCEKYEEILSKKQIWETAPKQESVERQEASEDEDLGSSSEEISDYLNAKVRIHVCGNFSKLLIDF